MAAPYGIYKKSPAEYFRRTFVVVATKPGLARKVQMLGGVRTCSDAY